MASSAARTGRLLPPTDPFGDANFTFGGFVTAGDIDGDGRAEWVVTPELRGGPRVVIFRLLADGTFDITSPGSRRWWRTSSASATRPSATATAPRWAT